LLKARHLDPVHLVDEEQVRRIVDPSAPLGPVEDRLGDRGFGPLKTLRSAREPIVIDAEVVALLVELPPCRSDHRLRLGADGLEDQRAHLPTQPSDVVLDLPRGVHDRRGVQDASVARHLIGPEDSAAGVRVGRRDPVPVGVVAGRQRLADPGRPVAEPDVAIAATGVAELAEPAVFLRLDEGRTRRISHRRTA
jgi:hypothetical protein